MGKGLHQKWAQNYRKGGGGLAKEDGDKGGVEKSYSTNASWNTNYGNLGNLMVKIKPATILPSPDQKIGTKDGV